MGTDPVFPPVAWFERLVNSAVRNFWEKSLATAQNDATGPAAQSPT
jgi:hypothetical protein